MFGRIRRLFGLRETRRPIAGWRMGQVPVLGPHGFYRMAYREWGDRHNPRVLVCVHGVTQNSRHFDYLAAALSQQWRVVCPDIPGRGESDYLPVKADYVFPTYLGAFSALIARLGVERVSYLGTSMGGIIGMYAASQPNSPIERLILNDVGPLIPGKAANVVAAYLGADPRFPDLAAAEAALRARGNGQGIRRPEHWRHLAEITTRPAEDGGLRYNYDIGIAEPYRGIYFVDWTCWSVWDAIPCPTLVLRGAESDLLLPETAGEMTRRGPQADLVTIAGCGHAPALMEEDQIAIVRGWLARQ